MYIIAMLLHSISLKAVGTSILVFHLRPSPVHLPLRCALSGTENHQPCLGPDPSEDWGKAGNGLCSFTVSGASGLP